MASAPAVATGEAPLGLIALNLGGPGSLDDVRPFLQRLFADPEVLQIRWAPLRNFIAWRIARSRAPFSRDAYAQIGGRSPILQETTAQVEAVAEVLAGRRIPTVPVVAMAAWHPLAEEALAALAARGVQRAIALPLYPQESRTTTDSSLNQIEAARTRHPGLEIAAVRRYPDAEGYLRAVVERIDEAIGTLPPEHATTAPVLFSAHGLPETFIKKGDPYVRDLETTIAGVLSRIGGQHPWRLSFQSRAGKARWLEPSTDEVLRLLAKTGRKDVLAIPISFVSDHIETLYEIDLLFGDEAKKLGLDFKRAPSLNAEPAFIEALAQLVEQRV